MHAQVSLLLSAASQATLSQLPSGLLAVVAQRPGSGPLREPPTPVNKQAAARAFR
jgi:hypothetical protein